MKFIWLGLIIEILILSLLKSFVSDFQCISILAVLIHALFTMIVLLGFKNRLKFILLGAFLARVSFMFWDIYGSRIFSLPNSGADSVGFLNSAVRMSQNISLLNEDIYGGLYSKINGILFYIVGPLQEFGQYINVLLGLSVIFILYKILTMLNVDYRIIRIVILIAAFFPNSLIMSAIFLREMFITFFVVSSLYFFIKWYKFGRNTNMLFAMLALSIASMFHSGVMGIAIGYAFMFLFYKREKDKFRFSVQTVFVFIGITIFSSLIFTQYQDVFLKKFSNVEEIGDIYTTANSRLGGSAYLTGITINSPLELLIYGPVKAFYFLTSPLPMDWRGFMDVFTFFTDSILYLGIILYLFIKRIKWNTNRTLIIGLIVTIISVSLIFGIGVSNAGTAMRHRQKLISLFLLLLALLMDGKIKLKNKKGYLHQ